MTSRHPKWSRWALAALAVGALGLPGNAQEPPKDDGRFVYVPTEDWDQVLKSDAKGVLLTREEFDRLRRRATANQLGNRPAPAVLESASHEARVDGDAVRGTATFVVKSNTAGTSLLPLALDGIGVVQAQIDGRPALLARDGQSLVVAVEGVGRHTLTVQYTLAVTEAPDGRRAEWRLPNAPAGTLRLALPGEHEVHVDGAVATTRQDGDTTRTDVVLGGATRVGVRFRSKLDEAPREAAVEATANTWVDLRTRDVQVSWDIHFAAHRAPVQEFRVPTPAGWVLTEVTAPELLNWNLADDQLTVRLRAATDKPVRLVVRMERLLDASGRVDVPFPAPAGLIYRDGRVFVRAERELRVRPIAAVALREEAIDPRWRRDRPLHQLAYSSASPSLTLEAEVPAAVLTSGCNALVYVDEDEAWSDATWDIAVAEGPLFELTLALPAGVTPVRLEGVRGQQVRWEVRGGGADRVLAVTPAKPIAPGGALTFIARLRRDFQVKPGTTTALPWLLPPMPGTPEPGNVRIGIATHPAFRVREAGPRVGCAPISPQVVRERIDHPDLRLGYELTQADGHVPLEVEEQEPRVELQVTHVARWTEDTVRVHAWLQYRIKAGALRVVRFRLPAGIGAAVDIRGAGVAEKDLETTAEGDVWTVRFAEKQRDGAALFVGFSTKHPINEAAGRAVPLVRALDVDATDGRLAIETAPRMELTVTPSSEPGREMRPVDPGTVALGELSASGRLLAAYRYAGDAASCTVKTTRFEQGAVANLVVTNAITVHHADPDRGTVTEVRWTLAEAGLQEVQMPLPANATLLSLTVDGKPEKPTQTGGVLLVPLPGSYSASRQIRLLYMSGDRRVGALGTVATNGAAVAVGNAAVPVLSNQVHVVVPSEFRALRAGGSMRLATELRGRALLREIYEGNRALAVGGVLCLVALLVLWAFRDSVVAALPRPRFAMAAVGGVLALLLLGLVAIPGTLRSRIGTEKSAKYYRDAAPGAAAPSRAASKSRVPHATFTTAVPGVEDSLEEAELDKSVREERKRGLMDEDIPAEGDAGEPMEDPVVKDAEDAPRPANKPMAPPEAPGDDGRFANDGVGIGGGAGGRAGGKRATAGTTLDVGGTGAIAGLQALDLDYSLEHGSVYEFRGATSGGTAWVWVASDGLLRFLAFVLFVAGVVAPFLTRLRREVVIAALPIGIVVLTLLPEWAPGLADACNAGVIGAILGLGAACAAQLLREMRRGVLGTAAAALVALTVLVPAAQAQEVPQPPSDKIPGDGKIYVPYDPKKLGKPGDLGSRVYLPYEAFLKLFAQAYPERLPNRLNRAVAGHLRATYDATLEGEWIRGTADFQARAVGEGWVELPLGFAGAQVESATVDGQPAPLRVLRDGGVALLLPAPGEYRVQAAFRVRGEGNAVEGVARLGLAATPVASLTLRVPDASLRARIEGGQGASRAATGNGGVALPGVWQADLGAAAACKIKWEPRSAARASEGMSVGARTRTEVVELEGLERVRVRATFDVNGGERDAFRFALGADVTVLDVQGDNVRGWTIEDAGGDRQLVVRMNLPVRDHTTLEVQAAVRHDASTGARTLPRVAPLGVTRENGDIVLVVPSHLRWALTEVSDVTRRAAEQLQERGWLPATAGFQFRRRPFTLRYETAPEAPRLAGTIDVGAALQHGHVDVVARLGWHARSGSGVFAASALLPADLEVRTVTGPGLRTWWLEPADNAQRLRLVFADGAATRAIEVLGRHPFAADAAQLRLPAITLEDVERQSGQVVVVPDAGRDLRVETTQGLTPVDAGAIDAGARALAFRFQDAGWSGSVAVTPLTPRQQVEWLVHSIVSAAGTDHSLYATLRIDTAPITQVSVELPGNATGVEVEVVGLREVREVRANNRLRLDITLQEPFLGTLTLGVFAHTPSAGEGQAQQLFRPTFPAVDAARTRGHLLCQPLETQARLLPQDVQFLQTVPATEVPDPTRRIDVRRVTHAWRVEKPEWTGALRYEVLATTGGAGVAVHLIELETVVAREGVARTLARLHMQNRELQYLDITIPADATLLALFVDGHAERPAQGTGNTWKVPLPRRARGDLGFVVELQWHRSIAALGNLSSFRPVPPVLPANVKVAEITWSLWLPDEFDVFSHSGNMSPAQEQAQIAAIKAEKQQEQTQELFSIAESGNAAEAQRATSNLRRQLANWSAQIDEAEVSQSKAVQSGEADQSFLRSNDARLAQQRAAYGKAMEKLTEVENEQRERQLSENAAAQTEQQKNNLAAFKEQRAEKAKDANRYQEQEEQAQKQEQERADRLGRLAYGPAKAPQQQGQQDRQGDRPADSTTTYSYAPQTYFPTYYPTTPTPQTTTTTPTTPTGPSGPTSGPSGPSGGPTGPSGSSSATRPGFAGGPFTGAVHGGARAGEGHDGDDLGNMQVLKTLARGREGALSLRFDFPRTGNPHVFRVQGGVADLQIRLSRPESWGFGGDLLRWLAVIALLLVIRRHAWFGREGADWFPQVVVAAVCALAVGAALSSSVVAAILLILCAVDWQLSRGAREAF